MEKYPAAISANAADMCSMSVLHRHIFRYIENAPTGSKCTFGNNFFMLGDVVTTRVQTIGQKKSFVSAYLVVMQPC